MSLAVARAVPREAVRRRVVVWAVILAAAFVGLFALGLSLLIGAASGEAAEMLGVFSATLTVLGLYIVSFLSSLLAILLGAGTVASEVESGLASAVLARPLRRRSWLLQRWAALAVMVSGFAVVTAGLVMLVSRALAGYRPLSWGAVLAMLVLQVVVVLTLATMLGSRLGVVAAGVASFAGFGVAWLGGVIEFIGDGIGNQAMSNAGIGVSLLLPSDALWKGASYFATTPEFLDQVLGRSGLPFASATPPAPAFLAWSVVLVVAWVAIASRWLGRRDL